jgi:hypothetical protein
MEIITNDYSFSIEKTHQETWEQYYIRSQAIANCIDKYPNEIHKLEEIIQLSHYWIAYKYMRCSYKKWIEEKIVYLFGSQVY